MIIYENYQGSNQYKTKPKTDWTSRLAVVGLAVYASILMVHSKPVSAIDGDTQYLMSLEFGTSSALFVETKVIIPGATPEEKLKPTLVNIVSYITQKWEKHGTGEVIKALNCFYSESGLRQEATNTNTDKHKSTDYGVAQLNDYWQRLNEQEKTEFIANIDKAYKIYISRGKKFAVENGGAWYGKLCN